MIGLWAILSQDFFGQRPITVYSSYKCMQRGAVDCLFSETYTHVWKILRKTSLNLGWYEKDFGIKKEQISVW